MSDDQEITYRKIKVFIKPNGFGTVELDGRKLRNCEAVSIDSYAGRFPTSVTLKLNCAEVEAEIENVGDVRAETTNMGSTNREYAPVW